MLVSPTYEVGNVRNDSEESSEMALHQVNKVSYQINTSRG